jgi:predicted nucleic acid-binding protein
MAEVVLRDTGPLVALMDRPEAYHAWATEAFARLSLPWPTCQAVITETCFLLRDQPGPLAKFRRQVQAGHFVDALDFARLAPRGMELMDRYANVPLSFADACLVALAEATPGACIFTLDRDFLSYRQPEDQPLKVLAPFAQ